MDFHLCSSGGPGSIVWDGELQLVVKERLCPQRRNEDMSIKGSPSRSQETHLWSLKEKYSRAASCTASCVWVFRKETEAKKESLTYKAETVNCCPPVHLNGDWGSWLHPGLTCDVCSRHGKGRWWHRYPSAGTAWKSGAMRMIMSSSGAC